MDLSVHNLAIYSAQVLVVVSAATMGATLFRLAPSRARLIFWRAVVLLCLLLPLLPVRSVDVIAPSTVAVSAALSEPSVAVRNTLSRAPTLPNLITGILIIGAMARSLWLGLGLLRLAHLRRRSEPVSLCADIEVMRHALAPHAELRCDERLAQPVTFGLRRPVVLVPRRLVSLPLDIQRAVVCHELLHVGRRDWLWTIVEEVVRTVFWFHPAMRWALSQVRLYREETVDALAVAFTGARRAYMSALLLFADAPAPVPATLFARRRRLSLRIRHMAQEVCMSRLQLALAGTALVGVLLGSSWMIVSAAPLHARGPAAALVSENPLVPASGLALGPLPSTISTQETDPPRRGRATVSAVPPPPGVQEPSTGTGGAVRTLITEVRPEYPPVARQAGVDASVTLRIQVSAAGDVTRVDDPKWQLTIHGEKVAGDMVGYWASKPWLAFIAAAETAALQWKFEPAQSESVCNVLFTFRMKSSAGDGVDVTRAVSDGVTGGVAGGVLGGVTAGVSGGVLGGVPYGPTATFATGAARPGEVPPPPPTQTLLRVGGNIRAPQKLRDVRPVYPEDARAAKVQGVVILELTIGTDGTVVNARILRSIPMLDQAALDAATQWRYTPTLLNGLPVEVLVTTTINFSLQ